LKYVLDASVASRWYIKESDHPNAGKILEMLLNHPEDFAVPELFLNEMFAVLYRYHPDAGTVYETSLYALMRSGVLRYPMTPHIYSRADRFIRMGLTGYDAVYVALAEEIGGKWLSFDSKAHACIVEEDLSIDLFNYSI
jgi:predicted nucleic acid-binding protein